MADLLSGLSKMGLGNLEGLKLYDIPAENAEKKETTTVELKEEDFLFDKSFTCTLCDYKFPQRIVRAGKARLVGADPDLRPRYEQLDVLKYDVISCPECGYTALSRYFNTLLQPQKKLIKEMISSSFKAPNEYKQMLSYEEAFQRYQLCLANAVVKNAKASEKAYICLKTAWLLRGMQESLRQEEMDEENQQQQELQMKERQAIREQEEGFLQNAYEGFMIAISAESYPMCGMDEYTVDYLLAVLAKQFKQYHVASKMIAEILTSREVSGRMKDKARDLKDLLVKEMKEEKADKG